MPYHSKDELLIEFDLLQTANPKVIRKTEIGKSVGLEPIFLYSIGNPFSKSNFVMSCHGDEHVGPECQLLFAKWLLTSDDPLADEMLFKNCWRLIPVLNTDNYGTATGGSRKNRNGVDLNRNFSKSWRTDCVAGVDCPSTVNIQDFVIAEKGVDQKGSKWAMWHNGDLVQLKEGINIRVTRANKPPGSTTWTYTTEELVGPCVVINMEGGVLGDWNTWIEEVHSCSGDCVGLKKDAAGVILRYGKCYPKGCANGSWTDFPEDYNYRGTGPASEPETQAVRAQLLSIRPSHFLDIHTGEGGYFARGSGRAGLTSEASTRHTLVANKIREIQDELKLTKFPYYYLGIMGSATDDAYSYGGATAFLTEIVKTPKPDYSVITGSLYNYFFSFMKAFHLINQS